MAKVSAAKKSTIRASKSTKTSTKESSKESDVNLSRGQRKRLEKKLKVAVKLGKKPVEFKEKPLSQTSIINKEKLDATPINFDFLNTNNESNNNFQIKSNKQKKAIAVQESNRFKMIQNHQSFLNNPLEAISQHLQNITQK